MLPPSPEVTELARRILRHEASGSNEPEALAAGVERVSKKLHDEVESLIGSGGASALVRRARGLAKRDFPANDGGGEAGSVAVVAHILGLLVSLMGEDLGLRPVHKVWPQLASGKVAPRSREGGE